MLCSNRHLGTIERPRFRAVLFDFDGVIGNTMDDNYRAWRAAFAEHGIEIDKQEYFRMEGATTRAVAEFFLHKHRGDLGLVDRIVKSKEHHYLENHRFSLYQGIESLVEALKEKSFQLGVVSGASKQRISCLGIEYLLENFNVVVTGDDIQAGKPDPEPFLTAARRLGIPAGECVVVENAPYGIVSAKRAGMYCIAVCSTLDASQLVGADEIVEDLAAVSMVLGVKHHGARRK